MFNRNWKLQRVFAESYGTGEILQVFDQDTGKRIDHYVIYGDKRGSLPSANYLLWSPRDNACLGSFSDKPAGEPNWKAETQIFLAIEAKENYPDSNA